MNMGIIDFSQKPRSNMIHFCIVFVGKMSFDELSECYSLELGEEIAVIKSTELVVKAFFDLAFSLQRSCFARIVLHI